MTLLVTVVLGVALAGVGVWLLSGQSMTVPRRAGNGRGAPITGSMRSMFGFGMSYATAGLTCTIAPFLAVVVPAFRADSLLAGSTLFLLYAAGMGVVVGTAAVAGALAQQSLIGTAEMRVLAGASPTTRSSTTPHHTRRRTPWRPPPTPPHYGRCT